MNAFEKTKKKNFTYTRRAAAAQNTGNVIGARNLEARMCTLICIINIIPIHFITRIHFKVEGVPLLLLLSVMRRVYARRVIKFVIRVNRMRVRVC